MDKKRGIPKSKGLPVIGEKNRDVALVNTILAQIDPVMQKILEGIDGLERRLAVVEEVKQVFPAKVEVTVKHEYPKVSVSRTIGAEEALDEEMLKKYKSIIEDKKEKKEKK